LLRYDDRFCASFAVGDEAKARNFSRWSLGCNITATVIGVLGLLALIIYLIVFFTALREAENTYVNALDFVDSSTSSPWA